jgi:hypothetical protein
MAEAVIRMFGGAGKRQRSGTGSTLGGLSGPTGTVIGAVVPPGASPNVPLNPQQRSFAQAAGGNAPKRGGPSAPAFPRPQLRRGKAIVEHGQYASMERPAPDTPSPNMLYIDMRSSSLTPEQVLDAAFPILGDKVLGFTLFAAQKTLGLTFTKAAHQTDFAFKELGETGLVLYPAPSNKVDLLKLTLQGAPYWDPEGMKAQLPKVLADYGELVFLAPMVHGSNWYSDQWHATIVRKPDAPFPPEQIDLLGRQVIVDIPGQRRFCRHCESSTHVKTSCRQWQRIKSRQGLLAKDQADVAAANTTAPPPPPSTPRPPIPPADPKQHPLDQYLQPRPPPSTTTKAPVPPSEDQEMEDTSSVIMTLEEAVAITTAAAERPEQVPAELLAAARQFLAAGSGSGAF